MIFIGQELALLGNIKLYGVGKGGGVRYQRKLVNADHYEIVVR